MSHNVKRREFLLLSAAGIASLGLTNVNGSSLASFCGSTAISCDWLDSNAGVIYAKDGTKLATLLSATVARERAIVGGNPMKLKTVKISAITHGWSCEELNFPLLLQGDNGTQTELCQVTCSLQSHSLPT